LRLRAWIASLFKNISGFVQSLLHGVLYLVSHCNDQRRDIQYNVETPRGSDENLTVSHCSSHAQRLDDRSFDAAVRGNPEPKPLNYSATPSMNFRTTKESFLNDAYSREISLAHDALRRRDYGVCFAHLERAHVLAQRRTLRHTHVHWLMLRAGVSLGDCREVAGQVPRMIASVLFSRIWIPAGNTGRARVNALKPMPVPDDLRDFVS
jgi:hypothetical protein